VSNVYSFDHYKKQKEAEKMDADDRLKRIEEYVGKLIPIVSEMEKQYTELSDRVAKLERRLIKLSNIESKEKRE